MSLISCLLVTIHFRCRGDSEDRDSFTGIIAPTILLSRDTATTDEKTPLVVLHVVSREALQPCNRGLTHRVSHGGVKRSKHNWLQLKSIPRTLQEVLKWRHDQI